MSLTEYVIHQSNGKYKIVLTPPSDEWKSKLALTRSKSIANRLNNLMVILNHDPHLKELFVLNEFAQRIELSKLPPWESGNTKTLSDDDVMKLRVYLSEVYDGVEFSKENLYTAITSIASTNRYHPVKEMIESKAWDGVLRAETIFIDYLGADDNPYTRAVAKTWLTGAIKRIYEPGCKFEITVVLSGRQGRGKSTLAKALGGEWFTDGLKDMHSKDSKDFLRGAWVIELSELSAMRKTEIEEIKQFISSTIDRYRQAYGRLTQEFPRTNAFIATTNSNAYLKDLTGSRRFCPVPIDSIERNKDVFNIKSETIQQIWAEAYVWYKKRQPVYLSQEIEKMADEYREQAQDENPMRDMIVEYLNIKLPSDWDTFTTMRRRQYISDVMGNARANDGDIIRDKVTTRDVLIELFNRNPQDELRGDNEAKKIGMIINNLDGWKATRFYENGIQVRGYSKNGKKFI